MSAWTPQALQDCASRLLQCYCAALLVTLLYLMLRPK